MLSSVQPCIYYPKAIQCIVGTYKIIFFQHKKARHCNVIQVEKGVECTHGRLKPFRARSKLIYLQIVIAALLRPKCLVNHLHSLEVIHYAYTRNRLHSPRVARRSPDLSSPFL